MATSNDHADLPFIQAQGYTRGRPDGPPLWIVVHDMEASEHSGRAESTALYFANPSDGRSVSSHYTVDDNSVVQCVDLDDVAWTVGNRPGNNRGINWELSGFARQTRTEWLDPFGIAMFARAAPIMAADMRRFGIPNRWCTIADLRAFRPGLTTHNDLRVAFNVTTHTDPGSGFPRDYLQLVIAAALNEEEDDMPVPPNFEADFTALIWRVEALINNRAVVIGGPTVGEVNRLAIAVAEANDDPITDEQLAELVAAAKAGAEAGVDAALDGATVTTTISAAP